MQTALNQSCWGVLVLTWIPWIFSQCRGTRSESRSKHTDTDDVIFLSVRAFLLFMSKGQNVCVFKQLHGEKRQGIIRRVKGENGTKFLNFTRPASFGKKYSLLLPSVTDEDSGTYECTISANIGGKNMNLLINLIVNGKILSIFSLQKHQIWSYINISIVHFRFFYLMKKGKTVNFLKV